MKKKNKTKAKAGKKKSLLSGAVKSLKKLGKGRGLSKMTTKQKVVGGTALVALGLGYLATRQKTTPTSNGTDTDAAAAEQKLSSMEASGQ